jgi:hypothetical protein
MRGSNASVSTVGRGTVGRGTVGRGTAKCGPSRVAMFGVAILTVLSAAAAVAAERIIQLDPDRDLIGQQIYAVQTYTPTAGGPPILDIGLYDTGASVVSFSFFSNPYFPQPHLNPGGAGGQGVGGSVVGDVSQPGSILAGGILDFTFDFNLDTFEFFFGTLTDPAQAVPGIQVFVGTEDGSPSLPSLTGTPIHKPSVAFPNGSAAHVTMQGFDFGTPFGLMAPLFMPQLEFVPAGSSLTAQEGSTPTVRLPLGRFGTDNYGNEGSSITSVSNPTLTDVMLRGISEDETVPTTVAAALLFDTGAQVSLISSALAADLGLDLQAPENTLQVRGAAGTTIRLPGFTLGGIDLAAAIDGPEFDDILAFRDVPVFVYDLGIPGLDGILGMNLFNGVDEMLIDLIHDELSLTFYEDPAFALGSPSNQLAVILGDQYVGFAGHIAPAFGLGPVQPVPEPTTLAGLMAAAALATARPSARRRAGRPRTRVPLPA